MYVYINTYLSGSQVNVIRPGNILLFIKVEQFEHLELIYNTIRAGKYKLEDVVLTSSK